MQAQTPYPTIEKLEISYCQGMLDKTSLFSPLGTCPHIYFVCGCEGVGKTTLLKEFCSYPPLQGLSIVDVKRLAVHYNAQFLSSGRKASAHINALLGARQSFVRESTLVSHYDFSLVRRAKKLGYKTELVFVGVCNAEIARKRTQSDPSVVQRHFERGLANLPLAIDMFDRVCLIDNTSPAFKVFAIFENCSLKLYTFCPAWFRGIQKEKGYRFTGVYD